MKLQKNIQALLHRKSIKNFNRDYSNTCIALEPSYRKPKTNLRDSRYKKSYLKELLFDYYSSLDLSDSASNVNQNKSLQVPCYPSYHIETSQYRTVCWLERKLVWFWTQIAFHAENADLKNYLETSCQSFATEFRLKLKLIFGVKHLMSIFASLIKSCVTIG